ncbi:MAG: peptidoglycan-binding protein, partial [Microcoleus sp. SIO2G3]|nr:peptidoglycan-binding protein [Microcoleus sp. SIO2G3]
MPISDRIEAIKEALQAMEVIPYFYDFAPEELNHDTDTGSDGRATIAAMTLRLLCLTTIAALVGSVADVGLAAPDASRRERADTPMLMAQRADDTALSLDDSGEAVSQLQQQLAELGFFSGEVTGFYGEQTEAAVQQFQQENGLTADGVVGAETAEAIRQQLSDSADSAEGEARSALQQGDRGEQVEALQQRLSDLGYYTGGISGSFDSATQAAVIEFQTANGL